MLHVILPTLADLFVNLSAGWFGAAVIIPISVKRSKRKAWALTINTLFGILALGFAILLRSL